MIDVSLVHHLVATQFPQWKDLPVRPISPSGWDNRTFRLGEDMLVRLPSAEEYATQVEKERYWLPRLAPFLPLPIPEPLRTGEPTDGYPWRWSIYRWLEGDSAASAYIHDLCEFAASLARFLLALQHIDPRDGPLPGPHNFYRGGALETYDEDMRHAIAVLKENIDADAAIEVWETALATAWNAPPVWVHGDISAGNLLIKEGRLSAVLDFGMLTVGDPACDLAIAWTLFRGESREIFRTMLPLDAGTWARGRAWTLWKALITAAKLVDTNAVESTQCWRVIDEVLIDYRHTV